MKSPPAIVVIATAWGSKFGGINSFSTDLSRALAQTLTAHRLVCVCMKASEIDREDAWRSGVTLVSIDEASQGAVGPELSGKVIEALRLSEIAVIDWWVGHDSITGALALECKRHWQNSRCAAVMHMSYQDYAYVKHAPEDAALVAKRTEVQQTVLESADVGLAVGPLLFDRLKTIRGNSDSCCMLIPGLAGLATKEATQDRLHAITFGRFDGSESLVKQAPLAVAAFARAFRMGVQASNPVLKNARIRLIGAPTDVTVKLRSLANSEAGRLVNLEAHEFIEDHGKLRSLLHECNVCLMLSWHEGFGLSGWEAIGSGVPLVLSTNSGLFQLLHSLGGAATGCVFAVDVHGQGDGEPNQTDVETAKKAILAAASDISKARSNAKALRQTLRFTHNFTWSRTARDFAHALALPVTTTILDLVKTAPSSEVGKMGDAFNSTDLASAQRVLALVDANYQCGQYAQAIETIETLKSYSCLHHSPEIAMDATVMEAEILMRLNRYQPAIVLARTVGREADDRKDWPRYVRARQVENVILRDRGEYEAATQLARDLLDIAERHCSSMVESVQRALARSLALNGICEEAAMYGAKAHESAKARHDGIVQAKAALALGEAFRHGRDDASAMKWYAEGSDLSGRAGHTDCFLWSVLGLSDCSFLQGDLDSSERALKRLGQFMEKSKHVHPIESLHMRLSVLAIATIRQNVSENEIKALLSDYETLGIRWPIEYFDAIKKPGTLIPKRF